MYVTSRWSFNDKSTSDGLRVINWHQYLWKYKKYYYYYSQLLYLLDYF
jgi:hypothetical protein